MNHHSIKQWIVLMTTVVNWMSPAHTVHQQNGICTMQINTKVIFTVQHPFIFIMCSVIRWHNFQWCHQYKNNRDPRSNDQVGDFFIKYPHLFIVFQPDRKILAVISCDWLNHIESCKKKNKTKQKTTNKIISLCLFKNDLANMSLYSLHGPKISYTGSLNVVSM